MLAQLLEGLLKYIPQKIRDRYKTRKIETFPAFVLYKTSKHNLRVDCDGFIEIWNSSQVIPLLRIASGTIKVLRPSKFIVTYPRGNRIIMPVTPK